MKISTEVSQDIRSQFPTVKAEVIEKFVTRYAKPSGCCEILKWLCFRVIQAFLSIFGRSEWQKTEKLLTTTIYRNQEDQLPHYDPTNKKIVQAVKEFSASYAKVTLNSYLVSQEKNRWSPANTIGLVCKLQKAFD